MRSGVTKETQAVVTAVCSNYESVIVSPQYVIDIPFTTYLFSAESPSLVISSGLQ